MYLTSEDPSNCDQERIEDMFGVEIDSLKDDVMKAERKVFDLKKEIGKKEETINTLQLQCQDLDDQLEIAKKEKVQDELLIGHLEEKKRALKTTLRQIQTALEKDKATVKETLENSLRIEAEVRMKMENSLRREAELRKRMETNESGLKKQVKQMMDIIVDLQERLRQFENVKDMAIQKQVMGLKQRHDEEVEQMNRQIEIEVSEKKENSRHGKANYHVKMSV